MTTLTIRDSLAEQVAKAVAEQGGNVEALVEMLLEEYLEDLKDAEEAEEIIAQIERGEREVIPWEQAKAELEAEWGREE